MALNTKATRSNVERADIYQEVTDQIIEMLEKGVRPWSPSWASAAASFPLRSCGKNYQGINILLLWAQSMARGYLASWLTVLRGDKRAIFQAATAAQAASDFILAAAEAAPAQRAA